MNDPPRILLICPDGMLGRAWAQLLAQRSVEWRGVSHSAIDLTDPASVEQHVDPATDLVINCAAWTDVDGAEDREADADAVNGAGVGTLAQRCGAIGAKLIHYSTDYVFDGKAQAPYRTDHPADPINAYGRTKLHGEQALRRSGCDHLLIRTSWLYAPWGNNFVQTMVRLTAEKQALRIVNDQRGRPTSAQHLAATTMALHEAGAAGTHHVTDGGHCTWFELTRHIAQRLNRPCRVEPCTTQQFPRPAPRPAYSVLDLSATESIVGPMPHWRDNVDRVLEQARRRPTQQETPL